MGFKEGGAGRLFYIRIAFAGEVSVLPMASNHKNEEIHLPGLVSFLFYFSSSNLFRLLFYSSQVDHYRF